jgi:glucosylglycerate synthase
MAETETLELAVAKPTPTVGPDGVDLVFGLPSYASGDEGRALLSHIEEATTLLNSAAALVLPQALDAPSHHTLPSVALESSAGDAGTLPWLRPFEQVPAICRAALQLHSKVCAILGPDAHQLSGSAIAAFVEPLLRDQCDLVMPRYPLRPQEGLINRGVLYPMTRALFGKRIHFPLPMDAALSTTMMRVVSEPASHRALKAQPPWMGVEAVIAGARICELPLAVNHQPRTEGVELANVLASVIGPLFQLVEVHASVWQRSRGTAEVPQLAIQNQPIAEQSAIDAQRMLESFMLGLRNLHQIWSLVLPPVALFELSKLARLPAEQFRMPDSLWTRIVYDFALAHRLRSINRAHLFGAFTPLYLGWAASYAMELGPATSELAEQRTEKLAMTFETEKSYFLSRWRWPDRFNP